MGLLLILFIASGKANAVKVHATDSADADTDEAVVVGSSTAEGVTVIDTDAVEAEVAEVAVAEDAIRWK